jgi:hypothetical protein
MKTRLQKFNVCTQCLSVGVTNPDCICAQNEHDTVELEFEVCAECGHLIDDGNPADTEFNEQQLEELE